MPAVGDRAKFIEAVRRALYCSQDHLLRRRGYMLLRAAAKRETMELNMGGIARCGAGADASFRSRFLGKIQRGFDKNKEIDNLLLDSFFSSALNSYQASWRKALIHAGRAWCAHPGVLHRPGVL